MYTGVPICHLTEVFLLFLCVLWGSVFDLCFTVSPSHIVQSIPLPVMDQWCFVLKILCEGVCVSECEFVIWL